MCSDTGLLDCSQLSYLLSSTSACFGLYSPGVALRGTEASEWRQDSLLGSCQACNFIGGVEPHGC